MTAGLVTWDELGRLDGAVLAILNSPPGDQPPVCALLDELERRVDGGLHVVGAPQWRRWLTARGVPEDRVLYSADPEGKTLELNHFLESPAGVSWIVGKRFEVVVGSAPYAVYNDEVKDIFERRLALLLGRARFLAHTLPNPYVFVFDLPALLLRLGRAQKHDRYIATCRALVDELHREWLELGRPSVSDTPACRDVVDVLQRHLGAEMLAFDETSPSPRPRTDLSAAFAEVLISFRDLLRDRDQRLAERSEAVHARDALIGELHAERVAAVNLRDAIIDDLRRQHEPLLQRWRRKLWGSS